MVVRVEDLVQWSCSEPAGWSRNPKPPPNGTNGVYTPPPSSNSSEDPQEEKKQLQEVKTEGKKAWFKALCWVGVSVTNRKKTRCWTITKMRRTEHWEPQKCFFFVFESAPSGSYGSVSLFPSSDEALQLPGVKVLSYPQYCRYRSLQRRIQDGARGPELQDPHLLALGGIKVLPSARVMYCRDTFNHPTLESSACFSWQFSKCRAGSTHKHLRLS